MSERREPRTQHARLVQDLERAFVARHVELISRPAFERAALVCAYLRLDAERAEEAERAARDRRARHVEVNRDLAAPSDERCRPSETGRRARRADRSRHAVRSRRARCEDPQRVTPSSASRRCLYAKPSDPYEPRPWAEMTRWQGTTMGKRVCDAKVPAAAWAR